MSVQLINLSPDLKRLRDEGYTITVKSGVLIIEDVPYVNSRKEITTGILVSKLTLSGERAAYTPNSLGHVAYFIGEIPCHKDGRPMNEIIHQQVEENHGSGIITKISFSSKPTSGYTDYYHKMKNYITILSSPAASLDTTVTAIKHKAVQDNEDETVFNYLDTNSSRASISHISDKLKPYRVGIIGLGGTGSYILDFVAKTPVEGIHLFDGDTFYSHNAFRAPGAATMEELNSEVLKVEYFKEKYSSMHKGIHTHSIFIDEENLSMFDDLNYVFVAVDVGTVKADIFQYLDKKGIAYTDVGMGLNIVDSKLLGMVRTTSFSSKSSQHLKADIDLRDDHDDIYKSNIQVAELNALNAVMAVISWKRHAGFYQTSIEVGQTLFTVDTLNMHRKDDAA